jgi:type I restriction-modification system DNA methylase subunit
MTLSWNEIKARAIEFSKEWENDFNEHAEAKSFMDAFFNVFGVPRRRVATFESNVRKGDGKQGFIDLLWKNTILIEFKSRGKDLDKAHDQAKGYFPGLKDEELPQYILVSDFERFRLYDLEEDKIVEFKLNELVNNVKLFGFMIGYQKKVYKEQDPANIKAAEKMGKIHDRLKEIGYDGHPLEVYLVRLLFCLFAEDTTIFEKQIFQDYIEQRTNIDGSDLAPRLQELFQVLNTPIERRFKNIDEQLAVFPYVNGKLFEEILPVASFDSNMRQALLECCFIDWSKISPAIFGSMFQSVMNPQERRNLGAHYTSETNILKLIKPLFLDDLWKEFESIKDNKNKLSEFHKRISTLKFLDPACGCGNFLVITYRELRLLELEILRSTYKYGQQVFNISDILWLDVDMMYGIEYEEFPARIAEVAMWLMDHQMNMIVNNEFGKYEVRIPLNKAANIINGNALQIDWKSLIKTEFIEITANNTTVILNEPTPDYNINIRTNNLTIIDERFSTLESIQLKSTFDYILGNPPFVGKSNQSTEQKVDMEKIFAGYKGTGVLDYVTAWYLKAAQLIQNTHTKVAFVSTNSISQGEQVGILWNILFNQYKIKIHFAHRTFSWSNEAKGNAAVHVVIIGFANYDTSNKSVFEYENIKGEPHEIKVKNISPYLLEGRDIWINKIRKPICNVPEMNYGSMPNDGGNLLMNQREKDELIAGCPEARKYIRKFIMGDELINNIPRFCLWLEDIAPEELRKMSLIKARVDAVKNLRLSSNRQATKELGLYPARFGEIRQPKSKYIALPRVSSENRKYIPIAILDSEIIAGDKVYTIENASLFHFGILTSKMHMDWMRLTAGRLESRYSYSNTITYNNYPWPENPTEKQINAIETAAQKVLDIRLEFPKSSFADLYDPLTMPPALVKAHNELDKAVDLAYRPQSFVSEANRMEFLFALYEKYTADLFTGVKAKKKTKKSIE